MKKIFVAMVFAFAFATGMAIVTVIAQIDWTGEKLQNVIAVTDGLALYLQKLGLLEKGRLWRR
jgi:hypothetical protein